MVSDLEWKGAATDLYRIFESFLKPYTDVDQKVWSGLTFEQVGQIYTVTILKDLPSELWVSKKDVHGEEKEYKKQFQEKTRVILYDIAHRFNPDLKSKGDVSRNDLIREYAERSHSLTRDRNLRQGTIERDLSDILAYPYLAYPDISFERIGKAVVIGARTFYHEKPDEMKGLKYKVFLEYNRIEQELGKLFEKMIKEREKKTS